MVDILSYIADFLVSFFVILLLLVFFYGQNWQGWYASKQIRRSLKDLNTWRNYGIELIKKVIEPLAPESLTKNEIDSFIREMLNFFVIPPSELEPTVFKKIHLLLSKRQEKYRGLIKKFLPNIDEKTLVKISALFNTTTEIALFSKKVLHNLIVGEKTKSYLFLLQTASEITQTMLTAEAYLQALDSFMEEHPIGDSIGPLVVKTFVQQNQNYGNNSDIPVIDEFKDIITQKIQYDSRECFLLRPIGPECRVGSPGDAVANLINNIEKKDQKISLIVSIDAHLRMEGEKSGTIAQGLGVAVGAGKNINVDKFQIETVAIEHNPIVKLEAIVCRQSMIEAVSPISEEIMSSKLKIIQLLKRIIRTETKPEDVIVIIGIGNAIGISL